MNDTSLSSPPAAVIFAELEYAYSYDEAHGPLAALLAGNFSQVTSGHQSDSWIWIHDGAVKVAVDTFSSMTHQVKSEIAGEHVERVLEVLGQRYKLRILEPPQLEWHEDQ